MIMARMHACMHPRLALAVASHWGRRCCPCLAMLLLLLLLMVVVMPVVAVVAAVVMLAKVA